MLGRQVLPRGAHVETRFEGQSFQDVFEVSLQVRGVPRGDRPVGQAQGLVGDDEFRIGF